MPCKVRGNWEYPESGEVLAAVGLHTQNHYIGVRWQTAANYIEHRPIFDMYKGAERRWGAAPRNCWWDHEVDLELNQLYCEDDGETSTSKASDGDERNDTPPVTDNEDNE